MKKIILGLSCLLLVSGVMSYDCSISDGVMECK